MEKTKTVEMCRTPHGELPQHLLQEYMRASGNVAVGQDWIVEFDSIDYFHLVDPAARDVGKKWKKKRGMLPAREYNFTYAACKTAKIVTTEGGRRAVEYDPEAALAYVNQRLLRSGEPVYLPEMLAAHENPMRNTDEKPPRGYCKILKDAEDELGNRLKYGRS